MISHFTLQNKTISSAQEKPACTTCQAVRLSKPSQAKHKQAPEQRKHRQHNRGKGIPGHWDLTAERRGEVESRACGDRWRGAVLRRPLLAEPRWSLTSGEMRPHAGRQGSSSTSSMFPLLFLSLFSFLLPLTLSQLA